ncbi:(-)-germacrene D synthase-like [Iris pallida]|uniref:(-)-germacrene D synthase-like n=1 Tax=Iris pallida TaxID=29817 RepID=A0AAX6HB90_IRIPA|nr:(-)-germacrene D synthase-like [Iris pallida]
MSAIEQRIEALKKEVKTMFSTNDLAEKLTLVDDLHRLGIYYHFEDEIREAIRCINDHVDYEISDVRLVALRFRLLRQEGYAVSPGVFSKFKDSDGKFKQELSYDVEGLLQLYEASMLGTNDEPILEEAMDFARGHMERMLGVGEEPHTAQVRRALETPFHRGMRRLEARLYIPVYAKSKACNAILSELAKLDFNHLQSIHQAEIQSLSVWWNEMGLTSNLSFFRDRVAECYFWSLGVWIEPHYSTERLFIAKLLNLMTVLDDIYDAYGTVEELQLFTNVFERWDFQDVDGLPEYMRIFLNVFAGFMIEIEEELRKKGTLHHKHYIIESFKPLRNHVDSSLEICMRDEGITEQEALAKLNKMVEDAWKDINKECLNPFPSRKHLNLLALKFNRMIEVIYKYEDSFTNPDGKMKENIALLLVRPIED